MKRNVFLTGLVLVGLVLSACGGATASNSSTTGPPAAASAAASGAAESAAPSAPQTVDDSNCGDPDQFCVGLVTQGGKIDDKSFNQSAWEGVQDAMAKTGGFAKYIETMDAKDAADNIQQFIDNKYDVLVTVGFMMGEAATNAAKANPDVSIIGVDQYQSETTSNLAGLVFNEDKAGYAAGYLAGLMTTTNKIGAVLGTDTVPPVKLFGEGYKAGALAANPKIDVSVVYHEPNNAFADPEWGAAEAQKQLSQGADVIFGAGGTTGNGALIETAKSSGAGSTVFCIGVDSDQFLTVPEAQKCLITSAEKKIVPATSELVLLARDGKFPGGNFLGTVGLAPFHDTEAAVSPKIQEAIAKLVAGLQDGSIKTGVTL
ncbi:MAG: Membrane lipoprotein TmpC [Nitrospira sp.]|nr:Membrane lipoprotein TmpC [Nitrospira sp.]